MAGGSEIQSSWPPPGKSVVMEASLVRIGLALRAMRLVLIRAQVKLEDRGKSILSTVAAASNKQRSWELIASFAIRKTYFILLAPSELIGAVPQARESRWPNRESDSPRERERAATAEREPSSRLAGQMDRQIPESATARAIKQKILVMLVNHQRRVAYLYCNFLSRDNG